MKSVIKVNNLGKKYIISHENKARYNTLRDAVTSQFKNLLKFHTTEILSEDFWALKDIEFEIKKGDRVGIIGRNGAGKSTLLKILSRIVEPTTGRVEINGRVASLLEVGTGFHPELTGRENIYLNGAILGMSRAEIKKKFDEIVDFSEVEKFLDTPVKRYSSGMYVRLAFSVAAHLEPDILIVDEVLAVGDASFQSKCIGKMEDVSREAGRTILFVSHNMSAIQKLCNKGMLLHNSRLIEDSSVDKVIEKYSEINSSANQFFGDLTDESLRTNISTKKRAFNWQAIKIKDMADRDTTEIRYGEPFRIIFSGYSEKAISNVLIGLGIMDISGGYLCTVHQKFNANLPDRIEKGYSEYEVLIDPNLLLPGVYYIHIAFDSSHCMDHIGQAQKITISNTAYSPDCYPYHYQAGTFYYPYKWNYKHSN